jgi:hypothetical protein
MTWEMPASLQRLGLPPTDFGRICIPDSVTVLTGFIGRCKGRSRIVEFGQESELVSIKMKHAIQYLDGPPPHGNTLFVRLAEKALRKFRLRFEALGR